MIFLAYPLVPLGVLFAQFVLAVDGIRAWLLAPTIDVYHASAGLLVLAFVDASEHGLELRAKSPLVICDGLQGWLGGFSRCLRGFVSSNLDKVTQAV